MPLKSSSSQDESFPESVKLEARRLAAFKCCYCRDRMGDHVHHITPLEDGGLGLLDNAVLLCAQCHTDYGHRKDKRAQLRQARDDWYDIVARRYSTRAVDEVSALEDLATKQDLEGIEQRLTGVFGSFINSLRKGSASSSQAINVASTMINSISPQTSYSVAPSTKCSACGAALPIFASFCIGCGQRLK